MSAKRDTQASQGAAIPFQGKPPFFVEGRSYLDVVVLDKPTCKACGGTIRHTVTVGLQPQVYFHQRRAHRDCRLGFWLDPDSHEVRQDVIREQLSDREWVAKKLALLKERSR